VLERETGVELVGHADSSMGGPVGGVLAGRIPLPSRAKQIAERPRPGARFWFSV